MISRRIMIAATIAGVASSSTNFLRYATAQELSLSKESFENLLDSTLADEELRMEGANRDERQIEDQESITLKGLADRKPSARSIAKEAFDLIVGFEVSSPSAYESKYRRPIRPGGQSGVTIGVGYDVGYVKDSWLEADWKGLISETDIQQLKVACRKTGLDAQSLKASLQNIEIPWITAKEQFQLRTLPLYIAETEEHLPNTEKLSPRALGALVSLVYNRGASFKKTTAQYTEMRNIRLHMTKEDFDKIPAEFINMQRIWEGRPEMKGLLRRRELEAKLFLSGI